MIIFWRSIYFFSCCSLLLISMTVHSEEVKVVTEYLTPYQIKNPDGSLGRFSTEIVRAIFKQANKQPNFVVMPWARAYEVAKSEKNVMIFSIARTEERDKRFHWIGSLTNEKLYFWGLKSQFDKPIDDIEQLKNYKIAIARYSNVDQYLNDYEFKNVYKLSKEEQNIQMLFKGRADIIVSTELTLINKLKKHGLDFNKIFKIKEFIDLNNDLNLAISLQSDPKLVLEFQHAYKEIKTLGEINVINQKWGIPH